MIHAWCPTHTHTHMCTHTHTLTYKHTLTRTHAHTHTLTHTYTQTHTHTHAYTNTRTYTHIYVYICLCLFLKQGLCCAHWGVWQETGRQKTESQRKLEVGWRGCSRNYGMGHRLPWVQGHYICVWKIHVFVYSPDRTERPVHRSESFVMCSCLH